MPKATRTSDVLEQRLEMKLLCAHEEGPAGAGDLSPVRNDVQICTSGISALRTLKPVTLFPTGDNYVGPTIVSVKRSQWAVLIHLACGVLIPPLRHKQTHRVTQGLG